MVREQPARIRPSPLPLSQDLLPPGAHILVAVSGGADSMALLHALHAGAKCSRWRLTVAHLHHGLRGKAADADSDFVRDTAAGLKLPCIVGRARVATLARRRHVSIEMAGRAARYAFLARAARRAKADVIATAHTANDQAETVLLKLLRGAGRAGLSGIPAESRLHGCRVVRPLLDCSRDAIVSYLRAVSFPWREDISNADRAMLRNRVRHELLPLLEREFNPRIRETLARTSRIFAAEDVWLEDLTAGLVRHCEQHDRLTQERSWPALGCARLNDLPLAARRRVIRQWLIHQRLPETALDLETVDRIVSLSATDGRSRALSLGAARVIRRSYDQLILEHITADVVPVCAVLPVPGVTRISGLGLRITTCLAPGLVRERYPRAGTLPARASFSATVWNRRSIMVRSWRAGDRMAPWGMTGTRKVQDILVDQKIPRAERSRVLVLECEGEIIWVPGYRVARAWAVTDPKAVNLQICIDA